MPSLDDYIARVEGTCGAEKDVIVVFKFEKKDEDVANILKRAQEKKSIAGIIFDVKLDDYFFRLYPSGKAIFRSIRNREELNSLLSKLLL